MPVSSSASTSSSYQLVREPLHNIFWMHVFCSLVHCLLIFARSSCERVILWECAFPYFYSCGLSIATIEYSCPSVCVSVCVCVCVCVHDNSKNNKHIVVYENSSDEFDIDQVVIKYVS